MDMFMKIKSYKYITGIKTEDRVTIPEIDRSKYTSQVFSSEMLSYVRGIETNGRTALLIAGGPAIHHSDTRNVNGLAVEGTVVVKSQIGYNMYSIARMFKCEIDYVSINTNTCASSMYCLHEAKRLMNEGFLDVIVVAVDLVDDTQELLFKQLGIDLVCGDCISVVHLSKEGIATIEEVEWLWNRDSSPMSVSVEGYSKLVSRFDVEGVDLIKLHGSGTDRNTEVELEAVKGFNCKKIEYKSEIGHTQGASSVVEICMMLDREEFTKALVLASGLGGFYGGCIINKE